MTEDAQGRLGRRLRRILLLLPYAIRNPGVTVGELAERFGVAKRDLIDDLNLVFLCGLPGYGPGDLIDVSVDDDRVYVEMADYFAAPLRVTPVEALGLYAGGQALASLPGMEEADALRRALRKLGRALGGGAHDDAPDAIAVRIDPGPSEHLDAIRRAVADRRRVVIEYFSASRGELTERKVDPWGLVAALGRWYLVGWDHRAGDERMFRVDRTKRVTVTDEAADVPGDFDPERYRRAWRGDGGELTLALEISPHAATWFEDYYPVASSRPLDDGWVAVELVASGVRWAATLVVRLGAHARTVRPEEVVSEARAIAAALAARHAEPA
ncbi:MAG TPA: WYL domain-containing protein [Actinomycetota bacterium]|nr:WYL domain-containing protein [Actinomycetota bacterium]